MAQTRSFGQYSPIGYANWFAERRVVLRAAQARATPWSLVLSLGSKLVVQRPFSARVVDRDIQLDLVYSHSCCALQECVGRAAQAAHKNCRQRLHSAPTLLLHTWQISANNALQSLVERFAFPLLNCISNTSAS